MNRSPSSAAQLQPGRILLGARAPVRLLQYSVLGRVVLLDLLTLITTRTCAQSNSNFTLNIRPAGSQVEFTWNQTG